MASPSVPRGDSGQWPTCGSRSWVGKGDPIDGYCPLSSPSPFLCPPPGDQPPVTPLPAVSLSRSDSDQLHASALGPGSVLMPQEVTALRRDIAGGPVPPEPPGHQPPPRGRSHGAAAFSTAPPIGTERLLLPEAPRRRRGEDGAALRTRPPLPEPLQGHRPPSRVGPRPGAPRAGGTATPPSSLTGAGGSLPGGAAGRA